MLMPRSLILVAIAFLGAACATDDSRTITMVESFPYKELQSSPYEVSTTPQLRGISRRDIHEIEGLVARQPGIRKPILRMFAWRNDRVQVITGRDEHRGDIYNCFHVVKRGGKWIIEESRIEDFRATEDRAELLRRGDSST
jgi:hypothetical protein